MTKSRFRQLFLVVALMAATCLVRPATVNGQQDKQPTQQPSGSSSQPKAMNQTSDAQTFAGTVVKAGGKLALRDSVSKTTYELDDQERAKQFDGQQVKVSGTLAAQTKTIHVSSMSPTT
jgi:hypothetical protein